MDLTRHRQIGLAMVFTATLAWSTAGLFTRTAATDLPTIIVWRGVFGVLGMATVLALFQGRAGFARFLTMGRAGWLYVAVTVLTLPAYLGSLQLTSIAHVAINYAMVPFMTAALAWIVLRERPARSAIIASTLAFLGAVLMVGLGSDGSALGDGLALFMTIGMAVQMVLARRAPDIPALPAGMFATALTVLGALPFAGLSPPDGGRLLILAAFGLSNSLLGYALFLVGSKRIPAIETALIGALEAPIAPVWVWLLFGEAPGPATLAGGAVVMTAVFWHILSESRR